MRLIDADELMEHVWRDKLDSRELIAKMIETAPTVKEIPAKVPIEIFEKLISQEPQQKTGHWIYDKIDMNGYYLDSYECSVCKCSRNADTHYCPNCGAKMVEPQESEE